MSFHVYVSKAGFKDNPISVDDWVAAVKSIDDLLIQQETNRNSKVIVVAKLKSDKTQCLSLTVYGLVHAQNPGRDLIEIMFRLADKLNGNVYSEKLKPYSSVDDWEKRTKNYRESLNLRREAYTQSWYKRKPFIILVTVLFGLLVGYII